MTEQATFKNPFFSAALGSDGSAPQAGLQAIQAWMQAQAKLLEGSETLLRGWLDRSRAAADATVSAVQQISETRNPTEIAKIWTDFASSQAQRATEGAGAFYEQYVTMWQQVAEAARNACNVEAVARPATPEATEDRPSVAVRRAAS